MEMVDIILGSYNGEQYIGEQIDSILNNSYLGWRLFVCDDGSKDKTGEIVKEYEKNYPGKIFWMPNSKNKGVVANFLDGARQCTGEYIMFCDQDDFWLEEKIKVTLDFMKKTEQETKTGTPVVVFTNATVVNQTLDVKKGSFHELGHLDATKLDLGHMLMENKMMGCTVMFNRSTKEKLLEVPEELMLDMQKNIRMHDWWIALIAASFGKIAYLNQQTMLYRQHDTNVVGSQKLSIKMIVEKFMGFRKIREVLYATCGQADAFSKLYGDKLDGKTRNVIEDFVRLYEVGWIRRRFLLIKHGFLKSGVVRNIGLFLIG